MQEAFRGASASEGSPRFSYFQKYFALHVHREIDRRIDTPGTHVAIRK